MNIRNPETRKILAALQAMNDSDSNQGHCTYEFLSPKVLEAISAGTASRSIVKPASTLAAYAARVGNRKATGWFIMNAGGREAV